MYTKTDIIKKVILIILALCVLLALIDLIGTVSPLYKDLNDNLNLHSRGNGSGYYGSGYYGWDYEMDVDYIKDDIGHAWLLFFCHSAACVGICLLLSYLVDKSDTGILGYVNDHIGYASAVHIILIISIAVALLLAMLAMCLNELGFIIFASGITGLALSLMACLYIGCWFSKAAILKGHCEPVFFWFPFLIPTVGYLLAIAMPPVSKTE